MTSEAARQKEKTKMQEKVERDDQGMKRHTVKRCKTRQAMEIGFCIRIWLTSARHAVG